MGFESYLMSVIESLKTLRKTEAAEKTFSAASALFSNFSGSVASAIPLPRRVEREQPAEEVSHGSSKAEPASTNLLAQ